MFNNYRNLLGALILTTAGAIPSLSMDEHENYQNDQQNQGPLWEIVEEVYQSDFVSFRTKALDAFKSKCYCLDTNGQQTIHTDYRIGEKLGLLEDIGGWAAAIGAYTNYMTVHVVPSVEQWPIRGFGKKYNDRLLREINDHIKDQKTALFQEYQGK